VFKVMTYLATRRGIVLVALSVGMAVLNAKGGHGIGFADWGW
jgi:hypothetical protein